MGWKEWSYPIKFGLIIGLIWSIVGILGFSVCKWSIYSEASSPDNILCKNLINHILFFIVGLPSLIPEILTGLLTGGSVSETSSDISGYILILTISSFIFFVFFFIIGALIGLIYGKVKNGPSWLKGGITAEIIIIILALILFPLRTFFKIFRISNGFPLSIFLLIPGRFILIVLGSNPDNLIIAGLLSLIFYFFIGSFIGFIIGKIKSKNQT